MSTEAGNRPTRGRRPPRATGDDRELAILATAERLLEQRPLRDISIDELARGAGISRPTFYFYFRGKDAVLLALLDRVAEEADRASSRVLDEPNEDKAQAWRGCINAFYETFRAHRAVALALAEARPANAEVRELWSKVMDRWVERTAASIEAERERGAAPPGRPARDIATALNLMNERMLHATFAAEEPTVAEADVVDVLLEIWLRAIYG
ncbi:AcrR family transcriptional regulator [Amycolatopsis bartoniae]|uniref:HTH-type transcriptional regulator EthR n=1 Tax=Amycolatopsis bartoniae TaxID=941986 RepID=A0A8H9ISC1_9PSEU|nr:TetR/AcrR family transcriptional regulator [Amycolatopsis bartoniae]MBB2937135.1 AcrR family transcriptional regulator [Amycolatopsis bartoniae]TVT06008.1 TetR/AcrR family transcriptional regulator [Amycolatopsis bartoniae]GHF52681.1 HTH-type transcriptional regulator EthR [Amycolatopsis bartoniae]